MGRMIISSEDCQIPEKKRPLPTIPEGPSRLDRSGPENTTLSRTNSVSTHINVVLYFNEKSRCARLNGFEQPRHAIASTQCALTSEKK